MYSNSQPNCFQSGPGKLEVLLGFLVAEPVVAHIEGTGGAALLDGVMDKSDGSSVVKCDWCGCRCKWRVQPRCGNACLLVATGNQYFVVLGRF